MGKMKRVALVREHIENQVYEASSLVDLLEISIEELLDKFPYKLLEHSHKFDIDEDYYDEQYPD